MHKKKWKHEYCLRTLSKYFIAGVTFMLLFQNCAVFSIVLFSQNNHFLKQLFLSDTGKTNLSGSRCQKLQQYLLSNLHIS